MTHESGVSPNGSADTSEYVHSQHRTAWTGSNSGSSNLLSKTPSDVIERLATETIEVQAAYTYLSGLGYTIWGDWLISDPARRLEAAKWLGRQFNGVERVLKSNSFRPIG